MSTSYLRTTRLPMETTVREVVLLLTISIHRRLLSVDPVVEDPDHSEITQPCVAAIVPTVGSTKSVPLMPTVLRHHRLLCDVLLPLWRILLIQQDSVHPLIRARPRAATTLLPVAALTKHRRP